MKKKKKRLLKITSQESWKQNFIRKSKAILIAGVALSTLASQSISATNVVLAAETDNNISSTDSSKVNTASTKVELDRTALDEAIANAKKDSNITIKENTSNAGVFPKDQIEAKTTELNADYLAKANELNSKVAEIQAKNAAITADNKSKQDAYDADKIRYDKDVAISEANKNSDGYTKELTEKFLIFDNETTKDGILESVKADNYINSNKLHALKQTPEYINVPMYQTFKNDLTSISTSSEQESFDSAGSSFVELTQGKTVLAKYKKLNASYDGKKITNATFSYTLTKNSQGNKVYAELYKDPSQTITYGSGLNSGQESDIQVGTKIEFFDASGTKILAIEDKPFVYSAASLNSFGENEAYEYVVGNSANKFLAINGSTVTNNNGTIYSKKDNTNGTDGIWGSEWDGPGNPNAYKGAGVFVNSSDYIDFKFGSKFINREDSVNSMWFAFNTDVVSKNYVTPLMDKPTMTPLEKLEYTVPNYSLYEKYTPQPTKSVVDVSGNDINDKNLVRGDTITYKMTWDLNGYGDQFKADDVTTGVFFKDDYDEKYLTPVKDKSSVKDKDGKNILDQLDVEWNETDGVATLKAKDPEKYLKAYNGQQLPVELTFKVKSDVVGDLENTALQNTFGEEIKTNTVVNHILEADPLKDVVLDTNGESIDGKEIPLNTVFYYKLSPSIRPENYGGNTDSWTIVDTLPEQDTYNGNSIIYSTTDFILEDGTTVPAGTDITKYFTVNVNKDDNKTLTYSAKEYLDIINSEANKKTKQGFVIYTQVKRNKSGTDIKNTYTEKYNEDEDKSNEVKTNTPEPTVESTTESSEVVTTKDLPKTNTSNTHNVLIGIIICLVVLTGATLWIKKNKKGKA